MSFLHWRKRKIQRTFHCMPAMKAPDADAIGATLNFSVIEERRRELGISKGELAELVGVDQSTIWRYRHAGLKPRHEVACRIADVLELTVDEIRVAPSRRVA